MSSQQNIRKKLIERINQLSDDKLTSVNNYIDGLEQEIQSQQSIMDYSGIFKDLDSDIFDDLTSKLHTNRTLGGDRIQ